MSTIMLDNIVSVLFKKMCVRGKSSSYNTSTNVQVLGNAPNFSSVV
jgi:hypothetical protein